LSGLEPTADGNVLVGLERPDDAGVYRLSDELALVQTVDYFTPVVDDPRTFGMIAAANALSDVWAIGGRPVTALNIVCFPSGRMEIEVLRQILAGGLEKLREAGCALVGGHSVDDNELKYGLAVTGLVHPDRFVASVGARPGDVLVLTKPLGTGVIATALKGGVAGADAVEAATVSMTALNKRASELMLEHGAMACTDVTGFGLVGHACDMLVGADCGLVIRPGDLPLLPGATDLAGEGLMPAGLHRNREYYACRFDIEKAVPEGVRDLLFDPQTSGGLLVALPADAAGSYVRALHDEGNAHAALIGEFVPDHPGRIVIGG
jgi:selenide,water dikinase